MQEPNTPPKLDYLSVAPTAPPINIPAVISFACGLAAVVFMLSLCTGIWQRFVPAISNNAGWIAGALALNAIVNGAIGALRASRESPWYNVALIGYASGIFVGTLTPVFFLM